MLIFVANFVNAYFWVLILAANIFEDFLAGQMFGYTLDCVTIVSFGIGVPLTLFTG